MGNEESRDMSRKRMDALPNESDGFSIMPRLDGHLSSN